MLLTDATWRAERRNTQQSLSQPCEHDEATLRRFDTFAAVNANGCFVFGTRAASTWAAQSSRSRAPESRKVTVSLTLLASRAVRCGAVPSDGVGLPPHASRGVLRCNDMRCVCNKMRCDRGGCATVRCDGLTCSSSLTILWLPYLCAGQPGYSAALNRTSTGDNSRTDSLVIDGSRWLAVTAQGGR